MLQKSYDTASEAINDLTKRGYTTDFSIMQEKNCLFCNNTSRELPPEDFTIDEVHRFEGATDPADEMILFAVSSTDKKIKGLVVNAFGIYSDNKASSIVEHLSSHL